ncbi:MAG TPA: hypothetical protein VFR67_09615 [Pilimelia sp.]|nr:hypothetical protein [Pilimelia sp.]
MPELLKSLLSQNVNAALWIAGAVVGAFTAFVGVTLAVALFHSDDARSKRAQEILRDLLALTRGRGK